ncbi:methyl-accepting chemotaxis protein [Candidatus Riflebacteria bacterium]
MRLMLKQKILFLGLFATLLPAFIIIALIVVQKQNVGKKVIFELEKLGKQEIRQISSDMYSLCTTANEFIQRKVSHDLNVAWEMLESSGGIRLFDENVYWNAVNQYTKKTHRVSLPKMGVGDKWLGNKSDFDHVIPVVDKVKTLVGGTCTIFQRLDESGSMIRIATNVKTLDKKRAIGTYIPAVNPDGQANPVIATVLKGETFNGRAFVVNAWYLTSYEPIIDESGGKIIGVLYVGVKLDEVGTVKKAILQTRVGLSGQVLVLGASGQIKGKVIITKEKGLEGNNVWNEQDIRGDFPYRKLIQKGIELQKGEVDFTEFNMKNQNSQKTVSYKAAITYFKPWDWVIVTIRDKNDHVKSQDKVRDQLDELLKWCVLGTIIMTALVALLAFVMSGKIANPLISIAEISTLIAEGDLHSAEDAVLRLKELGVTKDETGKLFTSITKMTHDLNSLVSEVQKSGIQVTSSATQIAASAKQLEATVSEQAASTSEVGATAKEISATSQELSESMSNVSEVASETGELADQGRIGLEGMQGTMHKLVSSTSSISSRFSMIKDRADDINAVVTTITKVADQTNLLSLNAAIEAEKAGEYGLGFAVVAREIRRLADQTAVATLDIEQMVQEMHVAVSEGIEEMGQFSREVQQGVGDVKKISTQLEKIIEQVQDLTPKISDVNDAVQAQAQGAKQISESMSQLGEGSHQTAENLKEFNRATSQLNNAARSLQNEVSTFKVNPK